MAGAEKPYCRSPFAIATNGTTLSARCAIALYGLAPRTGRPSGRRGEFISTPRLSPSATRSQGPGQAAAPHPVPSPPLRPPPAIHLPPPPPPPPPPPTPP